jgi:hypothetical protein
MAEPALDRPGVAPLVCQRIETRLEARDSILIPLPGVYSPTGPASCGVFFVAARFVLLWALPGWSSCRSAGLGVDPGPITSPGLGSSALCNGGAFRTGEDPGLNGRFRWEYDRHDPHKPHRRAALRAVRFALRSPRPSASAPHPTPRWMVARLSTPDLAILVCL